MHCNFIKIFFFGLALFACSNIYAQSTTKVDTVVSKVIVDSAVSVNDVEDYESSKVEATTEVDSFKTAFKKPDSTLYPVQPKASITDTVNSLKNQSDYWYLKYKPKEIKKDKEEVVKENKDSWSFLYSPLFSFIAWSLMIGFLVTVLVIYLNENNIITFKKKKVIQKQEVKEDDFENIFEIEFDSKLAESLKAGNYTLATRLQFLKLLKKLSQRNLIQYSIDKTNTDYLMHLLGFPHIAMLQKAFYYYEYVCYGDFEITAEQYKTIEQTYNQLHSNI